MAKPKERFRLFHRVIADKPAMVVIDESFYDAAERKGLTDCIVAWAQIGPAELDENGLPNAKALEQLQALDQKIDSEASRHNAFCAASLTTDGRRTWLVYGAKSDPILRAIGAAAKAGGPMGHGLGLGVPTGLGVRAEKDPAWKKYEEWLPTVEEKRWNDDLMVVEELEENGDILTAPRDIEHLAYLPTDAARHKFIEWLGENGFEVLIIRDRPERDGSFGIEFSKVSPIDIDEIYEQTCSATVAAEELGGRYDGWQTRIISDDAE